MRPNGGQPDGYCTLGQLEVSAVKIRSVIVRVRLRDLNL